MTKTNQNPKKRPTKVTPKKIAKPKAPKKVKKATKKRSRAPADVLDIELTNAHFISGDVTYCEFEWDEKTSVNVSVNYEKGEQPKASKGWYVTNIDKDELSIIFLNEYCVKRKQSPFTTTEQYGTMCLKFTPKLQISFKKECKNKNIFQERIAYEANWEGPFFFT